MKRENGYYLIKLLDSVDWQPAFYSDVGSWWIIGTEKVFDDIDITEVGEKIGGRMMKDGIPILEIEGLKAISSSEWTDEYLRSIGKEVLHTLHKELMCSPEVVSEKGFVSNSTKIIVQTCVEQ